MTISIWWVLFALVAMAVVTVLFVWPSIKTSDKALDRTGRLAEAQTWTDWAKAFFDGRKAPITAAIMGLLQFFQQPANVDAVKALPWNAIIPAADMPYINFGLGLLTMIFAAQGKAYAAVTLPKE